MCHSPSHFIDIAVGALGHGRALVLLDGVAIGQFDFVDRVAHLHDRVDRAFFFACHIAGDVNDRLQILAINAGIDCASVADPVTSCSAIWPPEGVGQLQILEILEFRSDRVATSRTSIGTSSRDCGSCSSPAISPARARSAKCESHRRRKFRAVQPCRDRPSGRTWFADLRRTSPRPRRPEFVGRPS